MELEATLELLATCQARLKGNSLSYWFGVAMFVIQLRFAMVIGMSRRFHMDVMANHWELIKVAETAGGVDAAVVYVKDKMRYLQFWYLCLCSLKIWRWRSRHMFPVENRT